jgi:hypothetical protein
MVLMLMQIIKEDIEPAKWDPNAFSVSNNKFVMVENCIKEVEGCYGFWDKERGQMICTGIASNPGCTFAARCWGPASH